MASVRSLVGSIFAVSLLATPAMAAPTEYTDPTLYLLVNGGVYTGSAGGNISGTPDLPNNPDGFVLTYRFDYQPPPSLLAITSTTNNILDGSYNVVGGLVEWLKEGGAVLASYALGSSNSPLPLTAGSGVYNLRISGVATGPEGGFVNYTLFSRCPGGNCVGETPLPGAVVLFGSVLAGGIGGMQIMRRRRKSA